MAYNPTAEDFDEILNNSKQETSGNYNPTAEDFESILPQHAAPSSQESNNQQQLPFAPNTSWPVAAGISAIRNADVALEDLGEGAWKYLGGVKPQEHPTYLSDSLKDYLEQVSPSARTLGGIGGDILALGPAGGELGIGAAAKGLLPKLGLGLAENVAQGAALNPLLNPRENAGEAAARGGYEGGLFGSIVQGLRGIGGVGTRLYKVLNANAREIKKASSDRFEDILEAARDANVKFPTTNVKGPLKRALKEVKSETSLTSREDTEQLRRLLRRLPNKLSPGDAHKWQRDLSLLGEKAGSSEIATTLFDAHNNMVRTIIKGLGKEYGGKYKAERDFYRDEYGPVKDYPVNKAHLAAEAASGVLAHHLGAAPVADLLPPVIMETATSHHPVSNLVKRYNSPMMGGTRQLLNNSIISPETMELVSKLLPGILASNSGRDQE